MKWLIHKSIPVSVLFTVALHLGCGGAPVGAGNAVSLAGSGWGTIGAGLNGSVNALTEYNGELYAGGNFDITDPVGNAVARWNGGAWEPQPLGMRIEGGVEVLATFNGNLIAGGFFYNAGNAAARMIAAWDGSEWHSLGSGLFGKVRALTVYNGDLIAAGEFRASDDSPGRNIGRWDGIAWRPLGAGLSHNDPLIDDSTFVHALTVYNGSLIAGGYFTYADDLRADSIARWDGSKWHALESGIEGVVNALAVYNGELIVGGNFFHSGNNLDTHLLTRWDGRTWRTVEPRIDNYLGNLSIDVLAVYNGELIVGGDFVSAGGIEANGIARWDGSSWLSLGPGLGDSYGHSLYSLFVYNGKLVVGGFFFTAGGVDAMSIATWSR